MPHKYLVTAVDKKMAILLPDMVNEASLIRYIPQATVEYHGEQRALYDATADFCVRIFTMDHKPYYRASQRYISLSVRRLEDIIHDLPHFIYATFRQLLLSKSIYPVHSCVIENTLFIGQSGAGKTTLVLEALNQGLHVFSGDRSLVEFNKRGDLFLLAGTQDISVRATALQPELTLIDQRGDRNIYSAEYMMEANRQPITKIVLFKQGNNQIEEEFDFPSKMHQILPHFLDAEKQNCCLTGAALVYTPPSTARIGSSLLKKMFSMKASVYYKEGTIADILQIAQE